MPPKLVNTTFAFPIKSPPSPRALLWLACLSAISQAQAAGVDASHRTEQVAGAAASIAIGTNASAAQTLDISLLTPEQIEQRLRDVRRESPERILRPTNFDDTTALDTPVSRIDDGTPPIGLDALIANTAPTPNSLTTLGIDQANADATNPDDYIPEYVDTGRTTGDEVVIVEDEVVKPNLFRRTYDRLFNDGVSKVPRLKVNVILSDNQGNEDKLSRRDVKYEPYQNIKAALEDITAESVRDFQGSQARLRQTAQAAARAVGYYDVKLHITKVQAGEINVIIDDLGEPVRVENRAIEVRGDGTANQNYQAVVNSNALQAGDVFHHGEYEASKLAIETVSGEEGYLDGRWLNNSVDVVLPDNVADVSLVYDTGQQYQFDQVVFFTIDPDTGELTTDPDKLPVKSKLLEKLLTFEMGDAYNRQAVRQLSNDLLATGYFNAVNTEPVYPEKLAKQDEVNFENTPKDTPEPTAPVTETVDLGDGISVEIAPLEFSASQAIRDKLDQVAQKANMLYNLPDDRVLPTDTAEKDKSILARISDAVSSIAKAILPDETKDDTALDLLNEDGKRPELANRKTPQQVYQDKKVPLYVFVASDKPRDAQIGLGWGSDTGARAITKFEHNLINRDGYQAGTEVRLSQKDKGVKLYGSKPLSHPLNDRLVASLNYGEETLDQIGKYDLKSRTLEQGVARNIITKNGWNRTYSLRYRMDELESRAPQDTWQDLPVDYVAGGVSQEALLAGIAINKTVADDLVNPMRGYRQYYSLEAGADGVVSETDLAIARAGISGIYSFGDNAYGKDRAHQLIAGIDTGYIWARDFDKVPYKLRFFAGGDQSIRGYNYNSLSPLSDTGYLVGGQALAVGRFEYNYEVMKDLRLAVFSDVGNAYNKDFSNDTKIGAGVGVRWASPVGQLRIDVATGVNEDDTPIKLHFFIGSPF